MANLRFNSALRWLLQVDRPVSPRTDQEIDLEIRQNYGWNFTVNVLDGAAFWFGLSFISSATVVPLYISKLTPSQLAIGLVAVIAQSAWFLPQLFTANAVERLARKKPVVVNLGLFTERLPIWLLVVSALIAGRSPRLALVLFFLGYAGHGLGAGLIATAWQDLIARCFPVDRRGRFFGITTFAGNGTGMAGAAVSAGLLASLVFPRNFVLVFLMGALSITASWVFLALTREPVQAPAEPPQSNQQFWAGLPAILRGDGNFRRFMVARLLLVLGGMGFGFVTVAAVRQWQVPDGTVGLYTTALLLGQTLGTLVLGFVADRHGHKLSLEVGALAGLLAYLLAWLAPGPGWYFAVFVLLGIASGATILSGILVVLEFAPGPRRPTYTGMTNTLVGVMSVIAPLLGAWLATTGYNWLFGLSAGFSLAALLAMHWWVQEPRWAVPHGAAIMVESHTVVAQDDLG